MRDNINNIEFIESKINTISNKLDEIIDKFEFED